jgi:hypothetical protein
MVQCRARRMIHQCRKRCGPQRYSQHNAISVPQKNMSDAWIGPGDGLDLQSLAKERLAWISHLHPVASIAWVVEVGIKKWCRSIGSNMMC